MEINMNIQKLTWQQTEDIYNTRMKDDFPPDELKPLKCIKELHDASQYMGYGLIHEDSIVGYAFFTNAENSKISLLDYLAVFKEKRNKGYGSQFLQLLIEGQVAYENILLEIEIVEKGADVKEREVRSRRKAFYLKNGVKETEVCTRAFGVDYQILQIPIRKELGKEEAKREIEKLYLLSLKDSSIYQISSK